MFTLIYSSRLWSRNAKSLSKILNAKLNYKIINNLSSVQINHSYRGFSDRRYSDKHEWVSLDSNSKIGTVGISHYAQEALGDVVYVQLPDVGNEYGQNDEVGAVESVKAASEIYTPVSGKVTEVNKQLEEKPGLVNTSCYDEGWIYKMELSKRDEIDKLMNEDSYHKYLKSIKEE